MSEQNHSNIPARRRSPSFFWPIMLIGLGTLFLLSNLDIIPWSSWNLIWRFWPIILIAIGIEVLIGQRSIFGAVISALLILALFAGIAGAALFAQQLPFLNQLSEPAGWQSDSIAQTLENYQAADIFIDWTSLSGELSMLRTSQNLIEGDLTYRGELVFDVRDQGNRASIQLYTRSDGSWFVPSPPQRPRASWKIYLTPDIPLALNLDSGSGSCDFDLSGLQLESLVLDSGSGSIQLTLPEGDSYPVSIDSGSGNLKIAVPTDAGVRLTLVSGSGSFRPSSRFRHTRGGQDNDGTWETINFNSADQTIEMTIDQGSGSITIE